MYDFTIKTEQHTFFHVSHENPSLLQANYKFTCFLYSLTQRLIVVMSDFDDNFQDKNIKVINGPLLSKLLST
jgi:hypothetical protein